MSAADELVSLREGGRAIVGTRAALAALVYPDPSRPVWVSKPQRTPGGGQVVHVRLAKRERSRRGVRAWWVAAGLGLVLVVAGVAVWSLLAWVVAHLALLGGVVVAVLLLWALGAVGTGCPGLHCAGCKHS